MLLFLTLALLSLPTLQLLFRPPPPLLLSSPRNSRSRSFLLLRSFFLLALLSLPLSLGPTASALVGRSSSSRGGLAGGAQQGGGGAGLEYATWTGEASFSLSLRGRGRGWEIERNCGTEGGDSRAFPSPRRAAALLKDLEGACKRVDRGKSPLLTALPSAARPRLEASSQLASTTTVPLLPPSCLGLLDLSPSLCDLAEGARVRKRRFTRGTSTWALWTEVAAFSSPAQDCWSFRSQSHAQARARTSLTCFWLISVVV
eukprot:348827-Hanusia_phi.AAC.1